MAQDYKVIPAQQSLKDSLPNLNSNFAAVASDFSGSAFPTNNLLEGMTCYRTDIKKVYRYVSTGKDTFDWKLVEDLNVDYGDALFAETAGKAEALNANIADTRTVATNPNDYNGVMKCVGIKRADAIALTSIDGISGATTAYVCGIRGFGDNSGGAAHETAYCSNGSVYHRTGDATSWGAWSRIVRTSDTIAANSAISAISAIKDGSGNIIVDTYLTKTGTAANSTKLNGSAASEYLKTNSPALTGTPTAPTAVKTVNNTQIATTAFVKMIATAQNTGGIIDAVLAQNGYVKFANGLILQWGKSTSTGDYVTHTFPIKFTVIPIVVAGALTSNTSGNTGSQSNPCYRSITVSNFVFCMYDSARGYAGSTYIAIGY